QSSPRFLRVTCPPQYFSNGGHVTRKKRGLLVHPAFSKKTAKKKHSCHYHDAPLAQFRKSRHNGAIYWRNRAMLNADDLLEDFKNSSNLLSLKDFIKLHPAVSRRTIQRWVAQLVNNGQLISTGQGRARRYYLT